jgi:ribosomal protein L37AE/L43A
MTIPPKFNKKECQYCDFKNPLRLGRAYYVCRKCGRDLTLELVLLRDLESTKNKKSVIKKRSKKHLKYLKD